MSSNTSKALLPWNRRAFLKAVVLSSVTGAASCRSVPGQSARQARFFFTSQGRTALVNADGSGLRYLELSVPNQATWQPGGFFSDGRRVLMLSMEPRRDGPGRPFEEYYTQTPTHLWTYDLDSGKLDEMAKRDRLAPFYTPQLMLSDERILVQVVRNRVGQIFSMNLDGSDAREFTKAQEGLPYGMSLSPDGQRVAYHLASPAGYQIWTSDSAGGDRKMLAAQAGHLYFGPTWSPDGQWLAFQDCRPGEDPGHDWADVVVVRADGTDLQLVTRGGAMWFGATYGVPGNRSGGSNIVNWTRDGALLFPQRQPGSKVPWEYQAQRPDTDHFNREYKPAESRGGVNLVKLDARTGTCRALTPVREGVWDFRCSESPDGRHVVFCRAETGGVPAVWVMRADGQQPRQVTTGWQNLGADHPRWLPMARAK